MARKNTVPYRVAHLQSLASAFNSAPTLIRYLDNISYQINVNTSNSIGTFSVQVSDDYTVDEIGNITNAGQWAALTLSGGSPFANGANDTIVISLNQLPYNAVRVAYSPGTPGTGTCEIYVLAKQIGG